MKSLKIEKDLEIRTSNFCHHIPENKYLMGKWVPQIRYVHPSTFKTLEALEPGELKNHAKKLKQWQPQTA